MAKAQYTGSGAISETFNPGTDCVITSIELHLSAAGATSENFTASKDDAGGAEWDVNYITQDMNGYADLINLDPKELLASESIVFAYTNTDARTWGLTIIWERKGYYYGHR